MTKREEARQDILILIEEMWEGYFSDIRFGQIMVNLIEFYKKVYNHDPFYTRDEDWPEVIEKFIKEYK